MNHFVDYRRRYVSLSVTRAYTGRNETQTEKD